MFDSVCFCRSQALRCSGSHGVLQASVNMLLVRMCVHAPHRSALSQGLPAAQAVKTERAASPSHFHTATLYRDSTPLLCPLLYTATLDPITRLSTTTLCHDCNCIPRFHTAILHCNSLLRLYTAPLYRNPNPATLLHDSISRLLTATYRNPKAARLFLQGGAGHAAPQVHLHIPVDVSVQWADHFVPQQVPLPVPHQLRPHEPAVPQPVLRRLQNAVREVLRPGGRRDARDHRRNDHRAGPELGPVLRHPRESTAEHAATHCGAGGRSALGDLVLQEMPFGVEGYRWGLRGRMELQTELELGLRGCATSSARESQD